MSFVITITEQGNSETLVTSFPFQRPEAEEQGSMHEAKDCEACHLECLLISRTERKKSKNDAERLTRHLTYEACSILFRQQRPEFAFIDDFRQRIVEQVGHLCIERQMIEHR